MSFRTTGILALCLVALAAYLAIYEFRGVAERRRRELESRRVVPIHPARVTRLALTRLDTTVEMEREDGGWRIRSPVEDAGDAGTIQGLIRAVKHLFRQGVIAEAEEITRGNVDLTDFGLDPPQITLAITQESGVTDTIFFGDISPTGGFAYVRRSGSWDILKVDSSPKGNIDKGLFHWRDKQVLPIDRARVRKIVIRLLDVTIVLEREPSGWMIVAPILEWGDPQAVDRFLRRIETAKLRLGVVDSPRDPSFYGFDRPNVTVDLFEKAEENPKTIQVGRRVDRSRYPAWFVRTSYRPRGFQIDSTFVASLLNGVSHYRNRYIFDFNPAAIDSFRLSIRESRIVCVRDTLPGEWIVREPKLHYAPPPIVRAFLRAARSLQVKTFLSPAGEDPGAFGLDAPVIVAEFYQNDEMRQSIRIGGKDRKVYAKGMLREEVVEINPSALSALELKLVSIVPEAHPAGPSVAPAFGTE